MPANLHDYHTQKKHNSKNKLIKTYFYKESKCGFCILDSHLARQLNGLQSMTSEIEQSLHELTLACKNYAKLCPDGDPFLNNFDKNDLNQLLLKNIYIASIMAYGKCFTTANRRLKKIETPQIRRVLSEEEFKYHEHVINLRDNWAAHGGLSDNEHDHTVLVFNPDPELGSCIRTEISTRYIPSSVEFQKLKNVTQKLLDLCKSLRTKKFSLLLEETNSLNQKTLRENAIYETEIHDL